MNPIVFFGMILLTLGALGELAPRSPAETVWYIITNVIAAAAWITLGILIHLVRVQSWRQDVKEEGVGQNERNGRTLIFQWIKPVTYSLKIFCGLSAIRAVVNSLSPVYELHVLQNGLYFAVDLALAVAVGYASVYYRKIPGFLSRIKQHQYDAHRFRIIMEHMPAGCLEIDTMSNIWYANTEAANIFGYPSRDDLLGRSILELMPLRNREKHLLGIENYLQNKGSNIVGRRLPTVLTGLRKDGTEFKINLTINRYDIGQATRFCVIVREVEEGQG